MKFTRTLALAAPLGLFVACGGSTGQTAAHVTTAQLAAATPSIANVSLVNSTLDNASPTADAPQFGGPMDFEGRCQADPCNPHLFLRGEEVVDRVNRHFYKFLNHVERAILAYPAHTTDDSATWKVRHLGVEAILTVTSPATSIFSWTLDLVPLNNPAGTTLVAQGTVDQTQASGRHQGTGDMYLYLNALASVAPVTEVAGTIDAHYEVLAGHRMVAVHADNVVWDTDSRNPFRSTPRTSYYVSYREPGTGGSLKVSEETEVPTVCPSWHDPVMPLAESSTTPIALAPAEVDLVSRWYVAVPSTSTTPAEVHGRSDAQYTGGALGTGNVLMALTCHSFDVGMAARYQEGGWGMMGEGDWLWQSERYSLFKSENLPGGDSKWWRTFGDPSACDPELNPNTFPVTPLYIPATTNSTTDFPFANTKVVNFKDLSVYPYPGYP